MLQLCTEMGLLLPARVTPWADLPVLCPQLVWSFGIALDLHDEWG